MKILIAKKEYIALKRFLLYTGQIYYNLKRVESTMNEDMSHYSPSQIGLMKLYKQAFQLSDNMRAYDKVLLLAKFMSNVSLALDPTMLDENLLAVQLSNMPAEPVTSFISSLINQMIDYSSFQQKVSDIFDIHDYCLDDHFCVKSFDKETKILNQLGHIVNELDKFHLYPDIKSSIEGTTDHFRKLIYAENKWDGISKRTLTDAIPIYLSQTADAITGTEQKDSSQGKDIEKKKEDPHTADIEAIKELCDSLRDWLIYENVFKWLPHFKNVNGRYETLIDQVNNYNEIQLDDSLIIHELKEILQVLDEILGAKIDEVARRTTDIVKKAGAINHILMRNNISLQTNISRIIDSVNNYRSVAAPKTIESLCTKCKRFGDRIIFLNDILSEITKEDVRLDELIHGKRTGDKVCTETPNEEGQSNE